MVEEGRGGSDGRHGRAVGARGQRRGRIGAGGVRSSRAR